MSVWQAFRRGTRRLNGRTFSSIESSTSGDGAFFEVATTIPFVAAEAPMGQ